MSEVRRAFAAISNSASSHGVASSVAAAASLRFGSDFAFKPGGLPGAPAERKACKTIRINVELFASDSSKYPEFDYQKLLHIEKKKIKKQMKKSNGFSDAFDENDDDVARIAKEFEKKYGACYGSGRGRNKRDDHCDIGLGYDESDSFIDNSEAYDEVVPEEVETLEGGFYINSGALVFKKLRTRPLKKRTDEIIKMPNRPKKPDPSSSSSSSDDTSSTDSDDSDDSEEVAEEETDGKASSSSGPAEKPSKTAAKPKPPVNKPNKPQPSETFNNNTANKKKDKQVGLSSSSNSPKPGISEVGSDSEKERKIQKPVKTTTVKDMLKAKRDSFLKMQGGGEAKSRNGELKGTATKSSDDDDDSSEDDSDSASQDSNSNQSAPAAESKLKKSEENSEKLRSSDTALPELDTDVLDMLQEFKESVKSQISSGKKFAFDDKLTELFLKIDEACLCIEKPQRNMVFAHLEYHLLMPKYYFLRKAKQLRIKEEKLKSNRALAKLRKAIVEAMPSAIASYEVELRKSADLQSNNLDSDVPPKMPKKKFPWNANMRNLLYDVYQVRWTSFPVLGTRKESFEEFITSFMKGKVVQLWPSGWMRYEELQREIEKRKQAARKSKEKKEKAAPPPVSSQPAATTSAPPSSSSSSAPSIKPTEEPNASENRSRTNSDTDSVASSAPSVGLKRKSTEKVKQTKSKAQKTIRDPDKPSNSNTASKKSLPPSQPPSARADVASPTKRTDHSIHNIIISSPLPTALTIPQQQQQQNEQQQKHSGVTTTGKPAAHVIHLDNYTSASDILMTSQQLLASTSAAASQLQVNNHQLVRRLSELDRASSSESDGVEIVGVFPPKPLAVAAKSKLKRQTTNSQNLHSATPTQYGGIILEAPGTSMQAPTLYGNKKNNNNTFLKGNLKSSSTTSIFTDFDASKVASVLKELEKLQQQHRQSLTITSAPVSSKETPNQ